MSYCEQCAKLERENAELFNMVDELMPYANGHEVWNRAEALVAAGSIFQNTINHPRRHAAFQRGIKCQ
jgi:hypothetical protein